jgi:hypothetical protein
MVSGVTLASLLFEDAKSGVVALGGLRDKIVAARLLDSCKVGDRSAHVLVSAFAALDTGGEVPAAFERFAKLLPGGSGVLSAYFKRLGDTKRVLMRFLEGNSALIPLLPWDSLTQRSFWSIRSAVADVHKESPLPNLFQHFHGQARHADISSA